MNADADCRHHCDPGPEGREGAWQSEEDAAPGMPCRGRPQGDPPAMHRPADASGKVHGIPDEAIGEAMQSDASYSM